jgi:hypothetical protein
MILSFDDVVTYRILKRELMTPELDEIHGGVSQQRGISRRQDHSTPIKTLCLTKASDFTQKVSVGSKRKERLGAVRYRDLEIAFSVCELSRQGKGSSAIHP